MKKITSIGEILFDVYPEGKTIGGAPFNFIYHITKLTGQGNFISRVGDDNFGKEIFEFLDQHNISVDFIQKDHKHKTGISRLTLNEEKVPVWDIESDTAYDFIELNDNIEQIISSETDCMYFGTLAQRELTTRGSIHSLFNKNITYFCDLNIRQNFYTPELINNCLKTANVLKLNIDELKLVNELTMNINFDMNNAARHLIDDFKIDLLCVTKGSEGAVIYNKNEVNHFVLKVDDVADTVGAGDAYSAILCLGYLKNWKLTEINKIASQFAAGIVKIKGALPEDDNFYKPFKEKLNEE